MDSSIKHNHTHVKFSLLGTDWVEWLIVGLLCVVTAAGVGVLTGSLVGGLVLAAVVFAATSAVVALL